MSDLKQARVLLMSAERDISALRGMADAAVFADEIFGFSCPTGGRKITQGLARSARRDLPDDPRSGAAVGDAERARRGSHAL